MRASTPVSHAAELKAKFNLPETPTAAKESEVVPAVVATTEAPEVAAQQVVTEVSAPVVPASAPAGIAASILARRGIKADPVSADKAVETQSEKKSEPAPAVAAAAEPVAMQSTQLAPEPVVPEWQSRVQQADVQQQTPVAIEQSAVMLALSLIHI